MIAKLKLAIGAGILIIATATISVIAVSKWDLFAPKDYEQCAERAAKDAKSKDGLSVLLSVCRSEFEGRRKAGGGYIYHDACQDRTVDINGPNRSPDEVKSIREQCFTYLDAKAKVEARQEEEEYRARQAAQEVRAEKNRQLQARQWAATPSVDVTLIGFDCTLMVDCDQLDLKFRANNRSKERLSFLKIGLASVPAKNDPCPTSFAFQARAHVSLTPGETGLFKISGLDPELSKHPICMKVLDVEISGD